MVGAPAAPKPATAAAPVTVKDASPAPASTKPTTPAAPAVVERPLDFEADDEVTRMADAGALAGAFTQAFGSGVSEPPPAEQTLSMPGDEWFVGINGVPVGPIRLSELRSKAASGAVNKESLVWRDGFEDWRPLKTYPELVAIVEEGVSSARASLTPFTPPTADVRDLTAQPATAMNADLTAPAGSMSAVTGSAVVTDEIAGVPRRGTSPMVWVAMLIAIALGLTMGFVIFGGRKVETKVVERVVEKDVHIKDPSEPVAGNDKPGAVLPADPQPKKSGGSGKNTGSAQPADSKPTNLGGLHDLTHIGPTGGPTGNGPSGDSNGGNQLDGSQIQQTVAHYTGGVKRRCWQPALDARAKDAPMTARVNVVITIGGTGTVQNVTTTGGDPRGYTGLANCIVSSVRSWQFPAAGGTTIANVPFVFAGQ
jgi:hypothetical protein